jgi:hypothetical protein
MSGCSVNRRDHDQHHQGGDGQSGPDAMRYRVNNLFFL